MRLLALIIIPSLLRCHTVVGQNQVSQANLKGDKIKSVAALEGRCAIIVRPDAKKIAQLKASGSQDDYNASVNDNEYYMGISVEFLDAVRVRQIRRQAHGVLIFKSSSGLYFKVALADFYWGIILFNGRTKPIDADVTDIAASYRAYMKK